MKELVCKVCGYEGQSGQAECPECGAPLHVVETTPAVEETAPAEGQEVYITPKKRRNEKHGAHAGAKARFARWAACFLALCLILQGTGLWLLGRGDGMFLKAGESWWIHYNDALVTPSGVFPLSQTAYVQGMGIGDRAVIMAPGAFLYGGTYSDRALSNTVYYYDGHTIQPTDWESGYLNVDGTVLFFIRREGEDYVLYRQDVERDRTEELLRSRERLMLDSMAQDGSAVTCYAWEDREERGSRKMWRWSRRTGTILEGIETEPERRELVMKLGRDGDNRLTYRFQEPGPNLMEEATFTVDWGRRGIRTELSNRWQAYATDRELTQILYRDKEGRWRYEDETGRSEELTGLEEVEGLEPLTPDTRGAWLGLARLTPWIYRGDNDHLYRIDDDLRVTDLTPKGEVEQTFIHPEGEELFYSTYIDGTFRIRRPLKKNWEVTRISEQLLDLTVAADLSVCAAKVWKEGKLKAVVIADGEEIPLEQARQSGNGWLHCLNGGGCWYEGKGHGLWFWSRETGEQKVMGPGNGATVISVGDGDRAILSLTAHLNPEGEEYSFWLLDHQGNAIRLEVREDGIADAADGSDGYNWSSAGYGSGGRLSPAAIPLT